MGATQSIPVVGEVVTIIDSSARTVAAGACWVARQPDAADKLIKSAGQSWVDYSEKSAIASNIQILASFDDKAKVDHLLQKQGEAWKSLGENTPVVGHLVGVGYLVNGDHDGFDRCMIGATRTAVIAGATIVTGGGALAAGAVAVGAAAAYDGVATGIHSARKGEYRPVGYVDAVTTAYKTGDARDIFNAISAPVSDFATGAMIKRISAHPAGRALAEGPAAAGMLADVPRVAMWELKEEVHSGTTQVPFAVVEQSGLMETATNTANLKAIWEAPGQPRVYDFVRFANGSYRFITHENAQKLQNSNARVGHTSLVEQNRPVVAAGEAYVNGQGQIVRMNSLSGHFQLPLQQLRDAMGPTWPPNLFKNQIRPRILFGTMYNMDFVLRIRYITRYTCMFTSGIWVAFSSAKYAVGIYSEGHVETALFQDEEAARNVFANGSAYPSRVLAAVTDGNLRVTLEKTRGPDVDQIVAYLSTPDRSEPVDHDQSFLDDAQYLQVLDEDNDDLRALVYKRSNQIQTPDLGRVRIISNEKEICLPCEIRLGKDPNFLVFWDDKLVEKKHIAGNVEILANQQFMHWVDIEQVKAKASKHLPVRIGFDQAIQLPIFCASEQNPLNGLPRRVGTWVEGGIYAHLFSSTADKVKKFDLLCWNPVMETT